MKTNSLFWALSWVAVGSFAMMQGCGGDDDDDGNGDDGGSSGKGGSAGSSTGGSSGKGGSSGSGSGGTSGKGGSSGSANGGSTTGGTAGAGGAPGGQGGQGGEGGAANERASVCADYCSTYFEAGCSAFDGGYYGTEAGCASLCEQAVWALGEDGDTTGNSVQCRLSHAEFAADASDPEMHCGHAKAEPTANCVP